MMRNLIDFHVLSGSQKIHKIPSGARFIIAGKKYINKQLSKHVTSNSQIDAHHKKIHISAAPKPFV